MNMEPESNSPPVGRPVAAWTKSGAATTTSSDHASPRPESNPVGVVLTTSAFLLWGILPLYWRVVDAVPSSQILAHRILWSAVLTGAISLVAFRRPLVEAVRSWRAARPMVVGGLLLGINWFTYIYAVTSGHVVEASMGYYINPLFSVVLGVLILRERLGTGEWVAFGFAATGVLLLAIRLARIPWIALVLTLTFGIYGLVKKRTSVPAVPALAVETATLAPVALVYLILAPGAGDYMRDPLLAVFLLGAGLVTALPLYLFAEGARKIMLAAVGFLQYIAPTMTLAIGVLIFGEPFTRMHLASFGLIWTGIVIFSLARSRRRGSRASRQGARRPS
ncbi:MAG: EamA family transporter RarD [Spirochaetota bacterium]